MRNEQILETEVNADRNEIKPSAIENESTRGRQNRENIYIKIGLWNVRTLNGEERELSCTIDLLNNKIEVAAICEHRIIHRQEGSEETDELLEKEMPNGYKLLYQNAAKNKQHAATGGVGFILNKKKYELWKGAGRYYKKISKRVLCLKFVNEYKNKLMFVVAYVPWWNDKAERTTEEVHSENEKFWRSVQQALQLWDKQ